jgi:hypothetical protein
VSARELAEAIQRESGDWLYKLFSEVDDVIENHHPGYLGLPLAERQKLIGALYAEVEQLP